MIAFNETLIKSITEKLPKIDPEVDNENVKIFKEYGTNNPSERRHTCVLCGRRVSINNSFSNMGSKLTCTGCVHKYFKDEDDYDV